MNEFKFEYKQINTKNIICDSEYQRQVDFNRVKRIVSNFNPNLVNPVKVSYRNGKYYVFDGQHTMKALITRNGNKDLPIDCKVYKGMTREDEARMFAEQNGIYKAVESNQKLLSLYVARDVDVMEFRDVTEWCGIKCDFKKGTSTDRAINCYKACYDIYRKYGKTHYQTILRTIMEAWDGVHSALVKQIVNGLNIFIRIYKDEYDRNKLVSRLATVSPLSIVRDGKALASGGDKRFAVQILYVYNKGARERRLDNKIM